MLNPQYTNNIKIHTVQIAYNYELGFNALCCFQTHLYEERKKERKDSFGKPI